MFCFSMKVKVSKITSRIVLLIFVLYAVYCQVLFKKYETVNDGLLTSMTTLLRTCTSSKVSSEETDSY